MVIPEQFRSSRVMRVICPFWHGRYSGFLDAKPNKLVWRFLMIAVISEQLGYARKKRFFFNDKEYLLSNWDAEPILSVFQWSFQSSSGANSSVAVAKLLLSSSTLNLKIQLKLIRY